MRPNLNEQCDSHILILLRNGITEFNITPIIVTLIDLIYTTFSERGPDPKSSILLLIPTLSLIKKF